MVLMSLQTFITWTLKCTNYPFCIQYVHENDDVQNAISKVHLSDSFAAKRNASSENWNTSFRELERFFLMKNVVVKSTEAWLRRSEILL